jgi:flagellar biosynthesis protein FlhA
MPVDYYALLSRYVGHRVCLSLHGQVNVWGKIASVCYDGLRVVDTIVVGELESPGPFSSGQYGGPQPPAGSRSCETLIHVNQVLAVTCLDDELPPPPCDREEAESHGPRLLVEPIELVLSPPLATLIAAELPDRLSKLRGQIASDLGLLLPEIQVRPGARLAGHSYVVRLRGVTANEGRVEPDRFLALETGPVQKRVTGPAAEDTPCGARGAWIERGQRELAEMYGYTILDPTSLIVARLDHLFRARAPELFGRQQLEDLLDQVRVMAPAIAEEVLPELIRPRQLQKILRNLLREGVPVRDMETILEALSDAARETNETFELTERVRQSLAPALTERYRDSSGTLYVVTLDPTLEAALDRTVRHTTRGRQLQITAVQGESILSVLATRLEELRERGRPEVVLTTAPLRAPLRALAASRVPQAIVLSHEEVESGTRIASIGMVFYSGLFQAC